jgi:hypothetical protein
MLAPVRDEVDPVYNSMESIVRKDLVKHQSSMAQMAHSLIIRINEQHKYQGVRRDSQHHLKEKAH